MIDKNCKSISIYTAVLVLETIEMLSDRIEVVQRKTI